MRRVVSYAVQRTQRLTRAQQRAWDERWSLLGRDVSQLKSGELLDIDEWFDRPAPVMLEIGSGMGDTTAQLAAAQPEVNYVAVEVYQPGLARLLLLATQQHITNLRLLRGDAVIVLHDYIAPNSLDGIRIFFPDPWPKRRHHKRRLIQPHFVALAASRLAPGATLHLATDWDDYAENMLEVCEAQPLLRNASSASAGWTPRPPWRPFTKFESRAVAEGRTVRDLIFQKI